MASNIKPILQICKRWHILDHNKRIILLLGEILKKVLPIGVEIFSNFDL